MTDKEKIRAEIERLKEIAEYNLSHCKMNRSAWIQQASVCTNLLSFINSMQEEPKKCMYTKDNYKDEDRKVLCDGCEEECKYVSNIPPVFDEGYWERLGEKPINGDLEKIVEEIVDPTVLNAYGVKEIANRLRCSAVGKPIEPVSEDLEQAIDTYLATYFGGEKEKRDWPFLKKMAIHFANWQKEQFEKNRLKHCNSITNEQAELEQGFIDQHLDKYQRMPTFLDAIEYGMRLQKEQMMAKAVDGILVNIVESN